MDLPGWHQLAATNKKKNVMSNLRFTVNAAREVKTERIHHESYVDSTVLVQLQYLANVWLYGATLEARSDVSFV